MLLHYLVKCITHHYGTVNNDVPPCRTKRPFISILNTQLVDMLLMMPQVVYATRVRSGLFNLAI